MTTSTKVITFLNDVRLADEVQARLLVWQFEDSSLCYGAKWWAAALLSGAFQGALVARQPSKLSTSSRGVARV